ncbi:MAG: ABC transporter ATP-binding protein/permease [Clostridiales bacterium]|jgi:ATP-binding cassette subfamily B protein|nr:ABC transporter ATP-binding protein/permease [Clostridiales bacterium]
MKRVLSNNWFIIKYALKTVPGYAIIICLNGAVHGTILFFEHTYMIKYIIDCIQYGRPYYDALGYIIGAFAATALYLLFMNLFNASYRPKSRTKLVRKMQMDIYEKAAGMDLNRYDDPEFYNDFVWAMKDAGTRADAVLSSVDWTLRSVASVFTSGIFMLSFDKTGFIFVGVSLTASLLTSSKLNKLRYDLNMESRPMKRRLDYINRALYLSDCAKEIRVSDLKLKLFKDFDSSGDELKRTIKKRSAKITALSLLQNYFFNSFVFDGLYMIYLAFSVIVKKALSYGDVAALFRSAGSLKRGLGDVIAVVPKFQEHSLYIEKIRSFLACEGAIKDGALIPPRGARVLELNNLSFSYREDMEPVLKDITLTIAPGEKIAIVGYNGAGKTTLIKLIMRLYDASSGEIHYNGINVKEYGVKSYRDVFGAAFQDYQLFAATVAENVAMDSVYDSEKVSAALKRSGFNTEMIANGLSTELTTEFNSDGTGLSGGEAQKLCIARVLYKDCDIIILDEPSSALDPESEHNLNKMLLETITDRTVIFISHRLSTTRLADKIYMLEGGRIIESGRHDDLMKINGKYAQMFMLQAEKYNNSSTAYTF